MPVTTTVPTGSGLAPFATLARCARPVEEYLRRRAERAGARGRPRVGLAAVDLFLLHQFAALLPSPPEVIDLAADATGGASVALWLAHPGVREVWAPRRATEADWRETFQELAPAGNGDGNGNGASATDRVPVRLDGPMFVPPGDWAELRKQVTAAEQVLVLVAGADGAEAAGLLKGAVATFPRAVVAVAGLGRGGEPGAPAALLGFGRDHPGYRLRALRELSPFLARSDLALVYRADHGAAETALERIAAAFHGNFEFINLLNAVVDSALREAEPARAGDNGNGRAGRVAAA